jgi:hypothetical protein
MLSEIRAVLDRSSGTLLVDGAGALALVVILFVGLTLPVLG